MRDKWGNLPAVVVSRPAVSRRAIIGLVVIGLALAGLTADGAFAQTYPARPIRMLVGFSPGGPADVMARLIGQRMSVSLGQPVVVENRPGAGGTIAARAVADSDPDGYTLLLGNTSTLVISPLMYKNVGYDALKAFAPIARLGTTSDILVTNPSFPARSLRELIAYAKANPGKLNYSTPGIGTPPHLIAEMLKLRAGVQIVHVPYKSGGQSIQAVIAGEVQLTFENPAVALPLVQAGVVRALAVTSAARHPQAPDVPTLVEGGLLDFVSVSFTGVVGRAGIPAAIVAKLNTVINESLKSPDVAATLAKLAVDVQNETPGEFAAFLADEMTTMVPVIKAAGLQGVE
ncbi:MAG TPA: tripartite tricarboxylate transporter substrate binding protein [Xanthobacteraceae bacterium]|nr:tripartite tricarboxylate transporter substrate binding protein [Xanthobacteraceae bacterium]